MALPKLEVKEVYDKVMNIYELEKKLKMKLNNSSDDVIRFALLETLPPIADYSYAITILNENYLKYKDVRMAILIAFLTSTWESYRENTFIKELNSFLEHADNEQKAIIYYLNAYDILMHDEVKNKADEYINLLNTSISFDTKFVYNYYRLAQVSEKRTAKKLIRKALENVVKIIDED